ncbi:MAG: NUDIX hydrolase [Nitrososphaeraceae archaeon]|jgi:ADP-ribose pyrophosphatase YjhB (NUDIX family)
MKKEGYKNPVPAVDAIIQMDTQILLVKRKNEPFRGYMAIPGGFVNEGETVEDAAKREVREETSLDIELVDILGVYSDPKRDPRGHIMSTVFIAYVPVNRNKSVEALAADDASELEWIDLEAIPNEKFAFDHKRILMDYIKWKESGETFWSSKATKSSKS